ncbi:DUF2975 domain-containing protein [Desulfuribacillus alkaliarsenatis]|uniref:DUF2975 domain-containing protein n=1 Tax=Desulfuribacillus alkaliarsenatis TaxID=766136 RepID=A0A1E5G2D8_9FIRM|nr:DUF2975 domain-containing protein [Desulfuribacillus alkaliarsenatis]OEF97067.1 hypothetical protein BHF68_05560 [Desulfuribacillus alkaliarsenatis]
MVKNKSFFNMMRVILNISIIVLAMTVVGAILTALFSEIDNLSRISNVVMSIIGGALILYILISLKSIVKTVEERNPFIASNIKKFKHIAYSIFAIAFLYTIATYPQSNSGIELIATPYGSIKISVFIFIVLGFLALLLAEIFSQAIKIKDENDMTI